MSKANREAKARIKINKLLEKAGWRLLDDEHGEANIQLEPNIKITQNDLNSMGEDFESTKNGFIDYLLLDEEKFPLAILEAKKEEKNPLDGKEQARRYANNLNVRFIILSNGNLHYFWDLETGNPEIITEFPRQESFVGRKNFKPNSEALYNEEIDEDYIAVAERPDIVKDPSWSTKKKELSERYDLRVLRPYQLNAIKALQNAVKEGKQRFLFEMATGTGKTLLSAALIKLFLRTGNAKRVLFLVDRLELENQANKNFVKYLKQNYQSVIYKENRNSWNNAEIVISTIQSLLAGNNYRKNFSPTDFDLLISDEAHRSIGGNSRAVFEYFIGHKLGLTATPKDYLKNIDAKDLSDKDQRKWEKRVLFDTYTTFGCENSEPTFKYSLNDGVKEGYLINPLVVDARTEITTQLLSDEGYSIRISDQNGEEDEQIFRHKDFERKFFS
ncbi:MAG: DEAD/DEAH box helicase family protein, partial [Bacteriovoracales bacterium]|nr:DEAD/DEAH box helicase family protein [Bacteriovoracales bacterium]